MMFRSKYSVICLLLVSMVAFSSCKSSERKKLPDKSISEAIVSFATLPSFKTLFPLLDSLEQSRVNIRFSDPGKPASADAAKQAFRTGVLSGDLLLAERTRNLTVVKSSATELVNSPKFMLNKDDKNKYLKQLDEYYQDKDWEKLGKSLAQLKKKTETDLWEAQDHETYTLTILGGWVEATRQIFALVIDQGNGEKVTVTTESAWSMLRSNMDLFTTKALVDSPLIKETKARVSELASLESTAKGSYDQAQLKQAVKLCEAIRALYMKP